MRVVIPIVVLCAASFTLDAQAVKNLNELFAPDQAGWFWTQHACDLGPVVNGVLRVSFHKGYERTGIETSRLPFEDWSPWRSFRFDVDNQNREPLICPYLEPSGSSCQRYIYRWYIRWFCDWTGPQYG